MPLIIVPPRPDVQVVEGTSVAGVAALSADALAATIRGLTTRSGLYLFNGTTWDRARSGGSASPLLGAAHVADVHNLTVQADLTLNNSNKVFTVPAGTHWYIKWIFLNVTVTATVGNREFVVNVRDAGDVVRATFAAGLFQTAQQTVEYYFLPGVEWRTATINGRTISPIPPGLHLPAGWDLNILDAAAVDAAADDMQVHVVVDERTV